MTVRRAGDTFAFFMEGTGQDRPALRWDPAQWEALEPGGNPVVLRLRVPVAQVSLWAGGAEILRSGPENKD